MAREDRFAELLSRVAREVTLRQATDVCCGDLTLEQFQTLRAVAAADVSTIGTLSAHLRVDLSTMSRNVTLLERNGYLLRSRSEVDGRVVHVRLTAKGRRALDTLKCGERDVLKDVFQRLPPAERSTVLGALELLQDCLQDSRDGRSVDDCEPGTDCCVPPARKDSP